MTGPARTNKARREAEFAKSQREAKQASDTAAMTQEEATHILTKAWDREPQATRDSMPFAEWVDRRAVDRLELETAAHTWIGHNEIEFQRRQTQREQALLAIAKEHLDIHTFETRNHDSKDFHEVSVWGAHAALKAAYEAGRASAAPKPYRTVAERRREITGAAE